MNFIWIKKSPNTFYQNTLVRTCSVVFFALFLVVFSFSSISFSYSDDPVQGEIINVNYTHQVAFTDLNNQHLNVGDIVKVYKNKNFVGYLQVVGTSDAVSKLAYVRIVEDESVSQDFNKVSVGSIVVKVPPKRFSEAQPQSPMVNENKAAMVEFKELSQDYFQLSKQLTQMIDEKTTLTSRLEEDKAELQRTNQALEDLKSKNEALEKKLNELLFESQSIYQEKDKYYQEAEFLKKQLFEVKGKLNYISELAEKNLNAY